MSMFKNMMVTLAVGGVLGATSLMAVAHDEETFRHAPPGSPFVKVSDALPLPEFLPGLGILYVDPETLPAGPFLSYDREGQLSATVYMTPLAEMENGTAYDDLSVGLHHTSAVDIHYNAGHPGVEEPHAHVVLYHDAEAKGRLAE